MRSVLRAILAAVLPVGCQGEPAKPPPGARRPEGQAAATTKVVKIRVTAGGDISADGESVTLDQLAAKLADLKRAGGAVWYYRENASGEPHANATKVIGQEDCLTANVWAPTSAGATSRLPVLVFIHGALTDAIDAAWVSLGASGTPGASWPAYQTSDPYTQLDDTVTTGTGVRSSLCDFWDGVFGR